MLDVVDLVPLLPGPRQNASISLAHEPRKSAAGPGATLEEEVKVRLGPRALVVDKLAAKVLLRLERTAILRGKPVTVVDGRRRGRRRRGHLRTT